MLLIMNLSWGKFILQMLELWRVSIIARLVLACKALWTTRDLVLGEHVTFTERVICLAVKHSQHWALRAGSEREQSLKSCKLSKVRNSVVWAPGKRKGKRIFHHTSLPVTKPQQWHRKLQGKSPENRTLKFWATTHRMDQNNERILSFTSPKVGHYPSTG